LQLSRCLEGVTDGKALPGGAADHDCCVLCAAAPTGLRVEPPITEPILYRATRPAPVTIAYLLGPPLREPHLLSPLSRRGPPA
jgi:hypothetical protein